MWQCYDQLVQGNSKNLSSNENESCEKNLGDLTDKSKESSKLADAAKKNLNNQTSECKKEIDIYQKLPVIDRRDDPKKWWEKNVLKFLILLELVCKCSSKFCSLRTII